MKKLGLAALVALAARRWLLRRAYPPAYYPHAIGRTCRVYGPPRVYVAPRPVYVAPPARLLVDRDIVYRTE